MSVLVLDVETVPLAASLGAEYPESERSAPANYKDPIKIQEWRDRDREKWQSERVKDCSLSPRLGRVVCLGFALDGGDVETSLAREEQDETRLLEHHHASRRRNTVQVGTYTVSHGGLAMNMDPVQ
jgi:hypothetical protein